MGRAPTVPVLPPAVLTGAGRALPPSVAQRALWEGYFRDALGGNRWAERVFLRAGVERRHAAVDPTQEDISTWTTAARMRRYVAEGASLAKAAVADALDDAGVAPDRVGLLAVASCTGYAGPGVDLRVANDLGFAPGAQRLLIGHMGCYAAIPALAAVADHARAHGTATVLLCLELTTLHLQAGLDRPAPGTDRRPGFDLDQLVSHALFSDAAAAVVVDPAGDRPAGRLALVDVATRTDPATADHMTWEITDTGFRMNLSRRVPDVLARHVGPLVDELCRRNHYDRGSVAAWAVHPGGPRVIDVVVDRLGLSEDQVVESRRVLAEHGNCSSATILLILEELRQGRALQPGDPVVALAFGPGLTLYAALLEAQG